MADYLKLTEVAQKLGISERTARRYVKSGELSSVYLGGAYRVSEEDLERFLQSRRPEAPKAAASLSLREASAAHPQFSELPGLMAARERRGYSRNELAARSGVASSDIAELEEGTREADSDILDRLTGALDATRGELGFPPEQYASFLEEVDRDNARDNERIRQELAELDPSEMRALIMRAVLESRAAQKLRDAIEESPEHRNRKRPEAG